ncbi:MAG: hypothetical protein Q9218_000576 [Villophora microphyllina]
MYPEAIPVGAYSHLNFAFAFVDPTSFQVAPMSDSDKALYPRFTGLKNLSPGLQTWISIGGWSMNDPDQPTHATFSTLAGSNDAQSKFFDSLLSFMATYGFDGVDIDWEYPVAPERSGQPVDQSNYEIFLFNLKSALGSNGHNYGLSITIPSSYWYMRNFDLSGIAKHIDWFNVMSNARLAGYYWTRVLISTLGLCKKRSQLTKLKSYDLHGTWDSTDKYIGAVVNAHTNLTEIDQTMDLLWRNNINPDQVVLGLGFYGRSFTLTDPSCTHAGCPFSSGGNPGECSASAGTLTFAEIQRLVAAGAQETLIQDAAVKQVVFGGNQWVSYDDAETFKMKINYANSKCLGGTMVWAVSTDDSKGSAAAALSQSTGRTALSLAVTGKNPDPISSCQWGECGKDCPPGTSPAQRGDKGGKGNAAIFNEYVPTCQWRGTAPLCRDAKCKDGEVEITSDGRGTGESCWFNHKNLCCQSTSTDEAAGKCHWEGSGPLCAAPFGHAKCPSGTIELTNSNYGAGGEAPDPAESTVHNYLSTFKNNPSCNNIRAYTKREVSTDEEGKDIDPMSNNIRAYTKREVSTDEEGKDIDPTNNDNLREAISTLQRRQNTQLTKTQEIALIGALTSAFLGLRNGAQTQLGASISRDFDQTVGQPFGYSSDSFNTVYSFFPDVDPLPLTESLLCTGSGAGQYVSAQTQTTSCTCQLPSRLVAGASSPPPYRPHPSKRDLPQFSANARLNVTAALHVIRRNLERDLETELPGDLASALNLTKRIVALGWGDTAGDPGSNGEPSIGAILRGIVNGSLQFMYTRLIRYRNQDGTYEGIVEMAWRIPVGITGDRFRSSQADQYIVLHGHTTHVLVDQLQPQPTPNANRFPGIYQMNVYHGQNFDNQANRVNGWQRGTEDNPGPNQRQEVIECTADAATGDYEYWYPGHPPVDPCENNNDLMLQLGDHLREERILDGNTYQAVGGGNAPGNNHLVENLAWNGLPFGEGPSRTPDGTVYQLPAGWP